MPKSKQDSRARKLRILKVLTPEWGEADTYVCASGATVCAIEAIGKRIEAKEIGGARGSIEICSHGICDEDGCLLYGGEDGLKRLLEEDFKPIEACADAIMGLAGFGEDEKSQKKAVKEAEKNSKGRRGSLRSS